MATLHNPTENKLFCHRLQQILGAGETVELSDEEARDLKEDGGQVFILDADGSVKDSEPAPKRETKRGTKSAGVTSTPDLETRG